MVGKAKNIFLITDPNSDPDDLACLILLKTMFEEQKINLVGVVAAKGNAEIREKRAKFAKAALNLLGWSDVPVAVGGEYSQKTGMNDNVFYSGKEVLSLISKPTKVYYDPIQMMSEIFKKHDKITLLIIAPMNDVADFISYYPTLFKEKIEKIVVMSGCKDEKGYPSAYPHNNAVCYEAAIKLWQFAVENNLPLIWVPRETVYDVQVTHDFYDALEKIQHPLAQILLYSNKKLLEALWEDIHCGRFSHFDIARFVKVFMGNSAQKVHAFEDFENVWPKICYFNLYDAVAALTLDEQIFGKAGYFDACSDNKNVLTAKVKEKTIIQRRLYGAIVGWLEKTVRNKI